MIRLILKSSLNSNNNSIYRSFYFKRLISSISQTNDNGGNDNYKQQKKISTETTPLTNTTVSSTNTNTTSEPLKRIYKYDKSVKAESKCSKEIKDIFAILRRQLANSNLGVRCCFETYEKLPYRNDYEFQDLYLYYFKRIIEKGLKNKEIEALFVFHKERIHYFDSKFIYSEEFLSMMKEFLKYDRRDGEKLLLDYYNTPFRNTMVELFKFHMVDDITISKIFRLILSMGDLKMFDYIFNLYKVNQEILKDINGKKSIISNDYSSSNTSNNSSSNTELNLNGLILENLSSPINFFLIHRAILNDEYENLVRLLENSIKRDDSNAVNCFQIVLETCLEKKIQPQKYMDVLLKKENSYQLYKIVPLLLFYNQIKGKKTVFKAFFHYINQSVDGVIRREILSTMIPVCLTMGRYELALDWYLQTVRHYGYSPTYLIYAFAYYHTNIELKEFMARYWLGRLENFSNQDGNPIAREVIDEEYLIMLKSDFESFEKFKNYTSSIDISLQPHNELFKKNSFTKYDHFNQLPPSTYNKIPSSHDFNKDPTIQNIEEIICQQVVLPNRKQTIELKTDKYLASLVAKNIKNLKASMPLYTEIIKDYIVENYFKTGKMIPNDLLFLSLYRIRNDVNVYFQLLDAAPSHFSSLLFDITFYSNLLSKDFDKSIKLLSRQDLDVIRSHNTQLAVVRALICNNSPHKQAMEVGTRMLITMFKKGICIDELAEILGHMGRYNGYIIPEEIYKYLFEKSKYKRITSYHIHQLVLQGEIEKALEFFNNCQKDLLDIDSNKLMLEYVYPNVYPLNDLSNVDKWYNIIRNNPEEEVRTKLGFFDNFFKSLNKSGNGKFILEMVLKDKGILSNINQKTLLIIFSQIDNTEEGSKILLDLFKYTRSFETYHDDIVSLVRKANQVVPDQEITKFLDSHTPAKVSYQSKPSLFSLSPDSINFIEKYYIYPSIKLNEPIFNK